MHTVEITLEQVLLARDRRVLRQRALAARYGGTLLSFTMNIAGPVKDAPLVRLAFQAGLAALDRDLGQPLHRELIQAPTGPEALLVYDRPAPWVKERCLLLEEREAVGRLYDLDVLSPEGEKLSRPQSRRCLICGGPVTVCSRSRAHGLAAIRARTRDILADFAAGHLSALARQALEDEVDLTPKPGLVDRRNTGAHDDMDRPLFHRSAGALAPYFRQFAALGMAGASPRELQSLGRQAEHAMLAATGGVIGAGIKEAIRYGVARGLFSNEAGMGSTPHAHAVARVKHPAEQGLAAIIGLFIDTFIVVNMTAFVILCTGSLDGTTTGIALTQKAFTLGLGTIGNGFVAVCLLFFAFTTIVGWYFFAEQNVKYLVGVRYVSIYRVLVLAFIMAGSFLHVTLVWELADLFNGLMAIPNIIALIGLSKVVGRALEDYEKKFLAGETPEFGELAPVPADIPRYNGAPAQDPALEPKPQHHRRLGGLRNRFRRRPHNAQENDA